MYKWSLFLLSTKMGAKDDSISRKSIYKKQRILRCVLIGVQTCILAMFLTLIFVQLIIYKSNYQTYLDVRGFTQLIISSLFIVIFVIYLGIFLSLRARLIKLYSGFVEANWKKLYIICGLILFSLLSTSICN
jgi:hypothetical protein